MIKKLFICLYIIYIINSYVIFHLYFCHHIRFLGFILYFICFVTVVIYTTIKLFCYKKDEVIDRISRSTKNSCVIYNQKKKKVYYMDAYFKNELHIVAKDYDLVNYNNYNLLDYISENKIINDSKYIIRHKFVANKDICYIKNNRDNLDILAKIVHEIRTPLISLTNFESDNNDIVRETSKYLLNITDNLMDNYRIQNEKIELKNTVFSLESLIDSLKFLLIGVAKNKSIDLIFETNCLIISEEYLYTDKEKLMQIFINLINNAIKFSFEFSKVILNVDKLDDGQYCFKVIDSGIGISDCFKDKMFNAYSQENRHDKKGIGLGLNIVKNYANLINAKIDVSSVIDCGTTISVNIGKKNILDISKMENKRVLIIDDDIVSLEIIYQYLNMINVNSTKVEDGYQALSIIHDYPIYDIFILDFNLPIIDGYRICQAILESDKYKDKDFKIILMSAACSSKISMLLNNDKIVFLSKPIAKQDLYQQLFI